jgi:ATPase family protein associated with various cellular activities (AAA)/winged helix domain-containing protein
MSSPPRRLTFADLDALVRGAVEAVAAVDPNPTDPFRGLYVTDEVALGLARAGAPGAELDERLGRAAELLGLDALDAAVLGLCVAAELSPRYGRLMAYLHDDVTRKLPSPGLVSRLLAVDGTSPRDVLERFGRDAPLRRRGALRLLEERGPVPLGERPVKVAEALAAFVVGAALDEPGRDGRLRRREMPAHDPGRAGIVAELRGLLAIRTALPLIVTGPDAAELLAVASGRPLMLVDVADLGDADLVRDAALLSALEGRAICLDGLEALDPGERRKAVRAMAARPERAVICAPNADAAVALGERTAIVVSAPAPSYAERRAAWAALAGGDVEDVAAKFRLSVGQIAEAAEVARHAAAAEGADVPSPAHLDMGARRASTTGVGELATRLEPLFGWDELVLPERPLEILRSISAYLRHRDLVLSGWGYERAVGGGQGLKVLFAGESGTGKTMAGQVLARELGLDLFRIDLATVVSKYIGETEKNLDRIFDAAEGSNAILFFDEADALFGKRSEVSDSHDRYANIEVAYLLQRMELYPGAVILATNFRHNLDEAFLRRLDFLIDFPFPEPEDRERIWRLVLPEQAPREDDLDLPFLATQFKLSGGGIRNASMAAAFMAADEGVPIGMRHLVRGVALEYGKLGRLTLETDFERFHSFVRPRGVPREEPLPASPGLQEARRLAAPDGS